VLRVEHRPGAVSALVERIAGLEADPAEVRVVIETRHGLLVEALIEAGYTVLPVNPELVSRRRGPARKKDDAEDARICCLLALDRHAGLRQLIPHGQVAGELRPIAGDDERARGKSHHAALRALGNRWLEVLWHCLTHGVPYDETVHIVNRNRALSSIAA
jgi:transposase